MGESLSSLHDLSYLGATILFLWVGGGKEEDFPQKHSGPNFSRKKYIQDRVNSIVLCFIFYLQIKRQNRVADEKKIRSENILYFLLLNLLCRGPYVR